LWTFFAGSGTTLNAVNLLNEQDGYNRRCIIVTNNELSKKQTKALLKAGETPGSEKWESNGICRAVTWPRTKYTILGKRENGEELEGEYGFFSDDENRRLSDGFEANVEYFRLGFVDKNSVSLGRQFKQILPLLWLKSGAKGARPELDDDTEDPDMMICPENEFAVLVDETRFGEFSAQVNHDEKIKTVYLVTNSDEAFREMNEGIKADFTYQLYRDYVDNFSIGGRRNLG
jgi:adenine-specific DNA-methyltransferase